LIKKNLENLHSYVHE